LDLTSEPAVGESAAAKELRSESRPTEERESAVGAQQQHNLICSKSGKAGPARRRPTGRWSVAGQGAGTPPDRALARCRVPAQEGRPCTAGTLLCSPRLGS